MSSGKLSAWCDAIVEAGWLAIVITTPLLIGIYSSRTIELDKVAVVRLIAGVMAAAWLVKWIDQRAAQRSPVAPFLRAPLALPTLIVLAVYVIATLTSVAPRTSFFEAYPRPEGTTTMLSYVVAFALTAQGLRTRRQLDRLIAAIILTSLPVAVYGTIQHFELDPLKWSFSSSERVGSTLGNPIFMSAYLIMAFSLTLGQIVNSARTLRDDKMASARIALVGYVIIGAAQAAAMVFSASRGPWLGWFAGVVLFILIVALAFRKRRLVLSGIGLGAIGVAFLVVLNLPNSPLASLRDVPGIGRLVNLTTTGSAQVRTSIWEGAARTMTPHAPLQFPDGTPDALNTLRVFVGYGPDTLYLVSGQFTPPDRFSREATIDRNHNETWDTLVQLGLAGLLAYQFLFVSLFYYGLRRLGLIPDRRGRNLLIGLWAGLGLAGGVATIVLGEAKYLGVALPIGNAAGLVLYLVIFAFRSGRHLPEASARPTDSILLAALMAGFLAHFIETQFGIALAATRVTFWVFAAMLAAIISGRFEAEAAVASKRPAPSWVTSAAGYALIIAMILVTMLNNFVTSAQQSLDPLTLLWRTLTFNASSGATSYAILGLLLSTWAIAILIVSSKTTRAGLALVAALSAMLTLAFGIGLANQVGAPIPANDMIARADQLTGVVDFYLSGLILLTFALGILLFREQPALAENASREAAKFAKKPFIGFASFKPVHERGWIAIAPIALVTYLWVGIVVLNPIRADVAHKLGQDYDVLQQWDKSIALYEQAIRFAPNEDFYYTALGRAFKEKAVPSLSEAASLFNDQTRVEDILSLDTRRTVGLNRLDLLYAAQSMLLRARNLNPLYANHTLNLARFYLPGLPIDTPARKTLADRSDRYFAEAIRLGPLNPALWNEWANFDLEYRNDPAAALQKLEKSRALDPSFDQTYLYLGKVYVAKSDNSKAAEAYEQALVLNPALSEAQSKLAFIYFQQGRLAGAVQAYLKYIELAPEAPNVWEAHKNLALLYRQTGNLPSAIREAETAARLAPSDRVPQLNELVTRLHTMLP